MANASCVNSARKPRFAFFCLCKMTLCILFTELFYLYRMQCACVRVQRRANVFRIRVKNSFLWHNLSIYLCVSRR